MYKKINPDQQYLEDFTMQFGGKLLKENRWVQEAEILPWEAIEEKYETNFSQESGTYAINARIAFGAIYIKEREGLTDRQTVVHISENPYMQYFLGLKEFKSEPLFDASMMVHFRKRFPSEYINEINRKVFEREVEKGIKDDDGKHPPGTTGGEGPQEAEPKIKNKGKLILDGSCAPADIRYPNDLSLLNEARENLERIIFELWPHGDRQGHMTGYSRKKARKEYLSIAKQKKPRKPKIRKAIGLQLKYVASNIETVGKLMMQTGPELLYIKWLARIKDICELHRQQQTMYDTRSHSTENRIVSLRQPHIRPIVRGKAGKPYEFGQKLAVSVINGYTFVEKQSYDNFNEGVHLIDSAQRYKARYGCYPEAIMADTLYRNRDNLAFCKGHGIRLSGPRLGRPKKSPCLSEKEHALQDSRERNIVEGRLGVSKRRYGLDLVMCYSPDTALTEVALQFLCMNMNHKRRMLASFIFSHIKHWLSDVFSKKSWSVG
jgi:hypothetical protein